MRTEEDVRTALERIAEGTPDPGRLAGQLADRTTRPDRRRRTVPMIVVTALATATAAIAGPLAVKHLGDTAPRPTGETAAGPWSNWVTLTAPPKWQIEPRVYEPNRQVHQLVETGTPWLASCLVALYRNGSFDPAGIPRGSDRVDVNRKRGWIITTPAATPFSAVPRGFQASGELVKGQMHSVVWEPLAGTWALATCIQQRKEGTRLVPHVTARIDSDLRAALVIAHQVGTDSQRTLAPFRIGYLPAGLRPERVADRATQDAEHGHSFEVVVSDGDQATGLQPDKRNERCVRTGGKKCPTAHFIQFWGSRPDRGSDLEIKYTTDQFWDQHSRHEKYDAHDLVIHGMKAWYVSDLNRGYPQIQKPRSKDGRFVVGANLPTTGIRLEGNGVGIEIRFLRGQEIDRTELRKIAENLTLAPDLKNPATWFDASTAVPH